MAHYDMICKMCEKADEEIDTCDLCFKVCCWHHIFEDLNTTYNYDTEQEATSVKRTCSACHTIKLQVEKLGRRY